MPDVQNFFHKALAVIFAKVQYQKKAFCELYRVIPFSSCACNVCGSYARFNFQYKRAPLVLHRFVRHKYLREDSQWDKLWYNFPVVAQSHSGERAVFFYLFIFFKGQSYGIATYELDNRNIIPTNVSVCTIHSNQKSLSTIPYTKTFVPSDSSCCECDEEVVTAQFILRQVVFLSCDGVLSTIHFYLLSAWSSQRSGNTCREG